MKIVAVLAFCMLVTLANFAKETNAQGNYKKVCYFANWAKYRQGKHIYLIHSSKFNARYS